MSAQTMQQILMKATHRKSGREAYLLFAIPDPDGVPGHPLQCHCALINAFAEDPDAIANIALGNALVLEGPGEVDQLAMQRVRETLGDGWEVEMFRQRPR